jgi:hypothetical protein
MEGVLALGLSFVLLTMLGVIVVFWLLSFII